MRNKLRILSLLIALILLIEAAENNTENEMQIIEQGVCFNGY